MRFESKIAVMNYINRPDGTGGYRQELYPTKEIDCFVTPIQFEEERINERDVVTHKIKFFTKGDLNQADKFIQFDELDYTISQFADYGKLKMAVAKRNLK